MKKKGRAKLPSQENVEFQPWFMPKAVCLQIRQILPSVHLAKMKYYFADHGCLRCEKKAVLYGSNGFCENCSTIVRGRIVNSLKRRLKNVGVVDGLVASLARGTRLARAIIGRRPRA